jgi:hypothetical protein
MRPTLLPGSVCTFLELEANRQVALVTIRSLSPIACPRTPPIYCASLVVGIACPVDFGLFKVTLGKVIQCYLRVHHRWWLQRRQDGTCAARNRLRCIEIPDEVRKDITRISSEFLACMCHQPEPALTSLTPFPPRRSPLSTVISPTSPDCPFTSTTLQHEALIHECATPPHHLNKRIIIPLPARIHRDQHLHLHEPELGRDVYEHGCHCREMLQHTRGV